MSILKLSIISLLFPLISACSNTTFAAKLYSATSDNGAGAVATVNPLATEAGLMALEEGGNAIDAAVAAALTLGVVDGHNSGIGGGCFVMVRWADGSVQAIDGREMAPGAARRDMYLRHGKVDTSLSKTGALAVGIPGSLAAYDYLIDKGGKLTLADALSQGTHWAQQGFQIDLVYAKRVAWVSDRVKRFPAAAALLLDDQGEPISAGHTLVQADLAYTYKRIAKDGIDYFYRGDFSAAIGIWMKNNGGIITTRDFAEYQLKLREPLVSRYRDYTLYGFPPPSSGGVHVAQIMNILEGFELEEMSDADRYHLLAEAMKLAFADRAYWLGDPDFANVPRGLIDKNYATRLRQQIDLAKAAPVTSHSLPPGSDTDLFGKHTTHIAAADKFGNWVAITSTVNTSFGSKVVVPGTGVFLNNQMDDFSIQPGVPNAYGLIGVEANSVAPGKRPLSSMSPTLVLRNSQPVMTLGAAGGATIISQVVQVLINSIDLKMPLQEALATHRVHHQWRPDTLFIEPDMTSDLKETLEERGHSLRERSHFGATQAIRLDSKGDFITASEPRIQRLNR